MYAVDGAHCSLFTYGSRVPGLKEAVVTDRDGVIIVKCKHGDALSLVGCLSTQSVLFRSRVW
jgi:hypothetical protein